MDSPKTLVPRFFSNTASTYDKVSLWATLGKDRFWKNQILNNINGNSFLDLACGTGILTRLIAARFPQSHVVGVDISNSYLEVAKKNSQNFSNITFIHKDVEQLKLETKFDCIVSSYVPKYCDAQKLASVCVSHLKPGGVIVLHDFTYPHNTAVRILWNFYFLILRVAGIFIPSWSDAFKNLPQLIRTSSWVTEVQNQLRRYGLETSKKSMTWGCATIIRADSNKTLK